MRYSQQFSHSFSTEDHVIEISNDEDEVSEDEERQADDSEMQEEEEERSTGTNRTTFDTGLPTTHSVGCYFDYFLHSFIKRIFNILRRGHFLFFR